MTIIAIIPAGAGQVFVEEFREAVDAATAIAEFVGEYSPPKNVIDFIGHDAGATVPTISPGCQWFYDHTTLTLVELPIPLFEALFVEQEFDKRGLLVRKTDYAKKNLDGTFGDRVSESLYTYAKSTLLSETTTSYGRDGSVVEVQRWAYFTDSQHHKTLVRKERV